MRAVALLLLLLSAGTLAAQETQPPPRVYAAIGLGFVNLEQRGLGIDVPAGIHLILARQRLVPGSTGPGPGSLAAARRGRRPLRAHL